MNTLLAKIFLWFWLAMAVIGVTSLLGTVFLAETPVLAGWVGSAMEMYANTAVEQYEQQGIDGLARYLESLNQSFGARAVVVDPSGKRLLPNTTADLRLLSRAESENRTVCRIRLEWRCAVIVQKPEGRYSVFIHMPRPRRLMRGSASTSILLRVGLIVLTSGILCFPLARYLAKPLRVLQRSAQRLAEGDFAARAVPQLKSRNDELMSLARDFDSMADRIQTLVESQKRMFADISHELRSPLTRISVAVGLAEQGDREALQRIPREIERLNELIEQILLLGRLEAQQVPVANSEISLSQLLNEIAEDAGYESANRNVKVTISALPGLNIRGDEQLLRSAIENVVRNAVRYSPSGTDVEIQAEPMQGQVAIRVSDRGPGVPAESLDKLFHPFYRVAQARERNSGGAGLGLAIAQRAVQTHGGSIRVANRDGGGLLVEIHLPSTQQVTKVF